MENENQVEQEAGTTPENITEAPSQENTESPVEVELRKEQGRIVRSEEEKAAFSLKKNFEKVKELGLDPEEILGVKPKDAPDKDQPLTVAMLEQLQKENGKKTALQLAESIEDTKERELTKIYLENRIVPSGDAQEDLKMARALVNSVKNGQIAQLAATRGTPAAHSSSPSAPAKVEKEVELTREEQVLMAGFNLTKEQVLAARPKQ